MKFLKQLSFWVEQSSNLEEPTNTEEARSILTQLLDKLGEDTDLFNEIMETEGDENSEVIDLARMLQLLNQDDEFYQQQGIELLLSYDSPEAWDALMTGVSFENNIQHSILKLSPSLRNILFQNPYYDYSDIQEFTIKDIFEDLHFLDKLSELEELSIEVKQKCSLKGLEKLPKLKRLNILIRKSYKDFTLNEEWTQYFGNLENLALRTRYHYSETIDYSFVDSLPNLKKLSLYNFRISYENAEFKHQPELAIYAGDPKNRSSHDYIKRLNKLIPEKKTSLHIQELYLFDADKYDGLNLSFLERIQVDRLILHKQSKLNGISVFMNLPYEPEIQCIELRSDQRTWSNEYLQQFGADNLQDFLEDKTKRKNILQKICNQEKLILPANGRVHVDISVVKATEVQFMFPNQERYYKNRRLSTVYTLKSLPKSVQKIQFGEEGQKHGNWITTLEGLEQYTELKEVVCINFEEMSLKTLSTNILNHPSLEKVIFIGGKKRKMIPKLIRDIFEYREK